MDGVFLLAERSRFGMEATMDSTINPKPATDLAGQDSAPARHLEHLEHEEIRLYSHSDIFYWWPVWFLGFLFALMTYWDHSRLAVVPEGTEARRDWRVEVAPGHIEAREGLILPQSSAGRQVHLQPTGETSASNPLPPAEQPLAHMARNPYLGSWFFITLLVVFISTHAPLRGLWQWIAVLVIVLGVYVGLLHEWWGPIMNWFRLMHIHITMAGYLFISTWLFAIWLVTTLYFDRLTYMIFSAGQVRVRQTIGEGEKVYDVTNMNIELLPNILIRHRVLGFYDAGDLIVRTGGPRSEVFHWSNVLRVRSKLRRIERLLQTREVE
jgi:hypothetical protein